MRYQYFVHIRDCDNLSSSIYHSDVSKSDIHKMIDYYSKGFALDGIFIRPYIIQNPCPVGDKTDILEEVNK